MVSREEVKKAMDIFGITDIHVEFTYVKKVYKKLLVKWHPDSCLEGKTEEYTKRSAEINAAFDVLEKAYKIGMMGPGVKDFRETSSDSSNEKSKSGSESSYYYTNNTNSSKNEGRTESTKEENTSNTYNNNNQSQYSYDTYSYYRDLHERQVREHERRKYERSHNRYLIHNGIWNFVFYAICNKHIFRSLTEVDFAYKNMLIKETPYYLSVLIVIFYLLKCIYVALVLDGGESEIFGYFSRIYIPLAFVYPIIYTFMHGTNAAIVFSVYFTGWAVFEWLMDIKIYTDMDGMIIGTVKGRKLSLPFLFFAAEEMVVIVFGIYIAISAIFIK